MPSAQDIVDDAIATRDALHNLESKLNEQIDAIAFAALQAGRDITPAERAQRDHYRAAVANVEQSFDQLGFVTLAKLNSADDVRGLLNDVTATNKTLDDTLARLKQVETIAQEVADVAAQLPKVVQGLAQLLPLLA